MTRAARRTIGAVAVMALLAGCGAGGGRPVQLGDRQAPRNAVAAAEAAVTASPREAALRLALARAYMAAGRFTAAGKTYQDVLTLEPGNAAAAIGLALMETAVGRAETARARLAALTDAPPADAGLARALAGDVAGAIDLLGAAARASDADARVRQNLALALALAGRWAEARAVASQDLPRPMVDERLGSWAALGGTRDGATRIASMLGTRPVADSGQPQALALVQPAPAAPAAAPVAVAAMEQHRTVQPIPAAAPLRLVTAPLARPGAVQLAIRPLVFRAAEPPAPVGRYVVQLGAYSTNERAERAWRAIEPRLAGRVPLIASRGPRTLIRLSVGGYASRTSAAAACRVAGRDCFVRVTRGDRVAAWWQPRAGQQLAAR